MGPTRWGNQGNRRRDPAGLQNQEIGMGLAIPPFRHQQRAALPACDGCASTRPSAPPAPVLADVHASSGPRPVREPRRGVRRFRGLSRADCSCSAAWPAVPRAGSGVLDAGRQCPLGMYQYRHRFRTPLSAVRAGSPSAPAARSALAGGLGSRASASIRGSAPVRGPLGRPWAPPGRSHGPSRRPDPPSTPPADPPATRQSPQPAAPAPSGRALARAPVGGGFPAPPFR